MLFENTQVFNINGAIRGMRNARSSWNKADTVGDIIGPNDMKLATNLVSAGPEHRKFLRQILVSVDITAPLYWWKEFDTYKVGTTANSTSTMHSLASTPITIKCFETDDYQNLFVENTSNLSVDDMWQTIINYCETLRQDYLKTQDQRYWKELIRLLPESWLQKRTITMNYENLLNICSKSQRRHHRLTEWSVDFINFAKSLPYSKEFIFFDEKVD